ncbi:MAG: DNA-3-methyladenine glycosylase I [Phycisphaerae bacterium]
MSNRRPKVDPNDGLRRCRWAATDPMLAAYHDYEWGAPIRTDAGHLERMALEIFQCGLSWRIVLVKRKALRRAFMGFNVKKVAAITHRGVDRLCRDASIIRNRRKILATIENARRFLEIAREHGSYRRWLDSLPSGTPIEIEALFPAFRERFKFMGPETTKCYLMGFGKIPPEHEPECWHSDRIVT